MREGWKTVKLGEVCTVIAGQSPKGSAYNDQGNGLPFYQGKKHFEEMFIGAPTTWTTQVTKEACPGDILMSVRAPVGPINFSTQRICIGRGLSAIRAGETIDRKYLFYSLLFKQDEIKGNEGAVFASINKKQIENIEVLLPPLPEQKRIVAILDEAFAGIEKAVANTEKNLANARELFESYLNSVFSQGNDTWLKCNLGDKKLLEIIDGDRGKNYPKKEDFMDKGYCLFLNTKNVREDGFNFESLMFISKEKDNVLRKGKLKRRDVVFTTRGTIGNVAVYDENVEFNEIRINSGMLILRPNEDQMISEYLFEIIRSSIFKTQVKQYVSGAAQPQLPIKTLVNFTIPVPDTLKRQREIVSDLRELQVETKHLESIYQQKLTALAELKQSLLQKAFSGELTANANNNHKEAAA